jgi:hypothetical protein
MSQAELLEGTGGHQGQSADDIEVILAEGLFRQDAVDIEDSHHLSFL